MAEPEMQAKEARALGQVRDIASRLGWREISGSLRRLRCLKIVLDFDAQRGTPHSVSFAITGSCWDLYIDRHELANGCVDDQRGPSDET